MSKKHGPDKDNTPGAWWAKRQAESQKKSKAAKKARKKQRKKR